MKSIFLAIVMALTVFYISPVIAESFDFKNWTYTITDENSEIPGTKFHMKNGKWKSRLKREDLTGQAVEASIDKVRYVDFDFDGEDEIIVQIGVSLVMDMPEVTEFFIIKYDENKIPKQIFNIETLFSSDFIVDKEKSTMTIRGCTKTNLLI